MPTAYILVGVPGSGKSTWIASQNWARHCEIVSTDDLVEAYARSVNKSYNDVFQSFMPSAVEMMTQQVQEAVALGKDIIWDQTSTTVKTRKKKFRMLPGYKMIAVVFKTPEEEEWKRRLNSRPGKSIPEGVLKSMSEGFEHPTVEEGFDQVWHAQ